jgi:hypothetical protein
VVPVLIWATSTGLPARVARHFGSGGLANGWMSRDGYVLFMIVMSTVFPLAVAAAAGLIPSAGRALLAKRRIALTGRQDALLGWLASHACVMGVLLGIFMGAVHFLVLEANARSPARLDEPTFFTVLIGFLVLVGVWIGALALRIRSLR